MRVSRRGSKLRGQDFSVSRLNEERVSTAGKKGTKNFVDPNRLFAGNLHFMVTTEDLKKWLVEYGLQDKVVECKVITDWRTGASKGYGFVQFVDPIYATSAMESLRNKSLLGRVVRLSQGVRKKAEPVAAFVVKDERLDEELEDEELVIRDAIADKLWDADDAEEDGVLDDESVPPSFGGFGQFMEES